MDIIGYCGVILPEQDFYQSYYVIRDKPVPDQAMALLMSAIALAPLAVPIGSLQAALVEGALTQNQPIIAAAAYALSSQMHEPYFVVIGHPGPEGTRTSAEALAVDSVDAARKAIENHRLVKEMKVRLLKGLMGAKH